MVNGTYLFQKHITHSLFIDTTKKKIDIETKVAYS